MSLDAELYWIGKPSYDKIARITGKDIHWNSRGLECINSVDINESEYAYIKEKAIPSEAYDSAFDWDLYKHDYSISDEYKLTGFIGNSVRFSNNGNDFLFPFDWVDKRYKMRLKDTYWFYESEEIHTWHNRWDINKIFEDEYKDFQNCGFYPLTEKILKNIKSLDPDFASIYDEGTYNIFYHGVWQ